MYQDVKNPHVSLKEKQISSDFRTLCDSQLDEMISMIWDEKGKIHHICDEGKLYFDLETAAYQKDDIYWTSVLDSDAVASIQEHFIKSDETVLLKDVSLYTHNKKRTYQAEITKFQMGNHDYFIGYFKDAVFTQDLRELLIDKDKQQTSSWLAAGLVHEIRNPLTSLKGFLQLLQSGITQKEEYYNVMIDEVEKLEDITNELLQVSKPDRKEKQLESVPKMIEDVLFIMRAQTNMRKIDFTLNIANDIQSLCNASQLKQVFINVIKNSVEAMNYEGTVQVEAFETDDEINILIKDEGKGFETEQIKEMKTPFYTTKSTGTGLGLVIINHILESHNGSFTIHPNTDRGMTVVIHLPKTESL